MTPTFGSLFSGIGGLDLACERVGMRAAWQVEVDPFCREVLAKHWPDVSRYDDVRTVGAATLAPVDVVVGGFPCQDVSLAGRGAGLAGERSGLWYEFRRIVEELRPRGVLVENVQGLVRRGLDAVVRGLVDLGYQVEASRIAASDVGAPHRRVRVFLVAWLVGHPSGQRQPESGGKLDGGGAWSAEPHRASPQLAHPYGEGQPQPRGADADERGRVGDGGVGLADTVRERLEEPQRVGAPHEQPAAARGARRGRAAEPGVGGGADGLPAWLDGPGPGGAWPAGRGETQHSWEPARTLRAVKARPARLKALGNAVVPQQGAVAAARLLFRMGAT